MPYAPRIAVFAFGIGLALTSAAGAAPLTEQARSALQSALEDEYRAEAFYAAVIEKFGAVPPFANIIRAERTHSSEIAIVMRTFGLEAGTNPLLKDPKIRASVPGTVAESCKAGVQAEIDNRDLYDKKLIPAAAGFPDIQSLFQRLRDASQNNHLPAFTRCAERR